MKTALIWGLSQLKEKRCKERGKWSRSDKTDEEAVAEINLNDFMNVSHKLQEVYNA